MEEEEIPMRERVPPTDEEEGNGVEESNGTEETSFVERLERLRNGDGGRDDGENSAMNQSIPIFGGDNLDFLLTDTDIESKLMDLGDREREEAAADTGRNLRVLGDLKKKEENLEKVYGKRFRGTYGPNSKKLLMSLKIDRGKGKRREKIGNVTGLKFEDPDKADGEGVSVIVGVSRGSARESVNISKKFKQLVDDAIEEFGKYADSVTYENIRNSDPKLPVNQEILDEVRDDTIDRIESDIGDIAQTVSAEVNSMARRPRNPYLSFDEERESRGIVSGRILENSNTPEENIGILDVEVKHWEELAGREKPEGMEEGSDERERSENRKRYFEDIARLTKLQREHIRLKNNIKPEEEETLETMEDAAERSNMRAFEKFKEWAKKNMVGLSAIAISVAGIITTIVMGAKNAAKAGGKALKGFAKSVANFLGKLGPLFSGLATLAAALIKFAGNGLSWLAKNLWILAVAITYALYEWWKNRKDRKRK